MYIIDFDAIYYFAPKHNLLQAFNNDGEGHWVPAFGYGPLSDVAVIVEFIIDTYLFSVNKVF